MNWESPPKFVLFEETSLLCLVRDGSNFVRLGALNRTLGHGIWPSIYSYGQKILWSSRGVKQKQQGYLSSGHLDDDKVGWISVLQVVWSLLVASEWFYSLPLILLQSPKIGQNFELHWGHQGKSIWIEFKDITRHYQLIPIE